MSKYAIEKEIAQARADLGAKRFAAYAILRTATTAVANLDAREEEEATCLRAKLGKAQAEVEYSNIDLRDTRFVCAYLRLEIDESRGEVERWQDKAAATAAECAEYRQDVKVLSDELRKVSAERDEFQAKRGIENSGKR